MVEFLRDIISKDGTAPTSEKLGKVSLVAGTWCAEKLGNEEVLFLNTDGVIVSLTGGDLLNITIRVYSKDSNYVRVGAITIAYKG